MLNIKIDGADLKKIDTALASMKRQIPFATAIAITQITKQVKEDEEKEIVRVFDRPTRFTRNSIFMQRATKMDLTAQVWLKDLASPRFQHYLEPQIDGGSRPRRLSDY